MSVMWSKISADRSGHAQQQQQGIIRCRAGVGGQGSHEAMESSKALICPLEKGVRGIETGHQMPGRSWRAGQPCGDGKPEGPDMPP